MAKSAVLVPSPLDAVRRELEKLVEENRWELESAPGAISMQFHTGMGWFSLAGHDVAIEFDELGEETRMTVSANIRRTWRNRSQLVDFGHSGRLANRIVKSVADRLGVEARVV